MCDEIFPCFLDENIDALARISSTSVFTSPIDHKLLCPVLSFLQECRGISFVNFLLSLGSYEQTPPTTALNEQLSSIKMTVYSLAVTTPKHLLWFQ